MATAMKTKKTAETTIAETKVEKVVEAPKKETPVKQEKVYKDSDGIPCKSITSGGLFMQGIKSGILYQWVDAGDIVDVEYQDVVAAIRSHSNYVTYPFFVIEDKELISKYPQVAKIYDVLYSVDDLENVLLDLSIGQMVNTIKALPAGAQESLKNIASKLVSNGTLDSVNKIKELDKIFDTELVLMTGLVGDFR